MILGPFIHPPINALKTESDACVEDDTRERCFASKTSSINCSHCIHNAYDHDHHQASIIKIHTTLIRLPQKHREEYFKGSNIPGWRSFMARLKVISRLETPDG